MANSRICSIDNCDKPHVARGFCNKHYLKEKKYGCPTAGVERDGKPRTFLENIALSYSGDQCLIWPYGMGARKVHRGSRPLIKINGKTESVCRIVCQRTNGPAPTCQHDAAHSCGNGHLGCVAKSHLSWKTKIENSADRLLHGTDARGERHPKAKLTEADVREIRSMRGNLSFSKIGKIYGVSTTTVGEIFSGRNWGWLV